MRLEERQSASDMPVKVRSNQGAAPNKRGGTRNTRGRQRSPAPFWRGRRAGVLSATRLALMRLSRNSGLLALIALGVLVADILICIVPVYTGLVTNLQLQSTLSANDPVARNVETVVTSGQVSASVTQFADSAVRRIGAQQIGSFTSPHITYYLMTDPFLLIQAGKHTYDPAASNPPTVKPQAFDYGNDLSSAAPHMRLISGRFPHPTPDRATPEVIITQEMANIQGIGVGTLLTLAQFGAHQNQLHARVVGVWTPRNPNDPYWNGLNFSVLHGTSGGQSPFPLLMSKPTLLSSLSHFSGLNMEQHWVYYTQDASINASTIDSISSGITLMRSQVDGALLGAQGITQTAVNTQLDQLIANVQAQQNLAALPLYVVVAQIVGLALLFVAAMASLLIDRQAGEIATLKSRGASGVQLLGVFLTQGALVGLLALVVSPFIAALAGLALVRFFVPSNVFATLGVGNAYFAQLARPQSVLLPALVGALLGVVVIGLTSWQAARRDVLAFRREQGRAAGQPFWRRYYLDLGLVVICIVGYLELGQFGSASVRLQLGSGASNLLLLLTPTLLLLAGALLTLRLVPMGAQFGERLASRGRGITALLSLAQVERSPGRYSRIILLLVLAVGLGLFAFSFSASLRQNTYDRVAYQVGADIRLTQHGAEVNGYGNTVSAELARMPGVLNVTPVYRLQASTSLDQGGAPLPMLAIDPATFASVVGPVSWRSDYASQSLDSLMSEMQAHKANPVAAGTPPAPIWTIVSQSFASQFQLSVGQKFSIQAPDANQGNVSMVVGAIVQEFPTLYPQEFPSGFIVISMTDYYNSVTVANPGLPNTVGPNEFWLRTNGNTAQEAALLNTLQNRPDLDVESADSLHSDLAAALQNPVNVGLQGLLLLGAIMAAALAIIGSAAQTLLGATQRATQFAVLRTLGLSNQELARILFGEQLVVYLFGLVGGTLLGAVLTTATLPYLQFSDPTLDPAKLGIPPYTLVTNWGELGLFYLALIVACGIALIVAARAAVRQGLGQALRIGED